MLRGVRMRTRTVLATLVGLAAFGPAIEARADPADPDPWFGRDKVFHFGASAVIAAETYGITAAFSDTRAVRLAVGGGVALAAGTAKELYDLAGYGDPSWRDFTWDVIGTVAGLALAYGIDLAVAGVDAKHPALAAPSSAAAPGGFVIRF